MVILAKRRSAMANMHTIGVYAKEVKDFLNLSESTERRAFIKSIAKEIVVMPRLHTPYATMNPSRS